MSNLLTADSGEHVIVEGVTPGTRDRHAAQADDNGVVRDDDGKSYGDGPYRIIARDPEEA